MSSRIVFIGMALALITQAASQQAFCDEKSKSTRSHRRSTSISLFVGTLFEVSGSVSKMQVAAEETSYIKHRDGVCKAFQAPRGARYFYMKLPAFSTSLIDGELGELREYARKDGRELLMLPLELEIRAMSEPMYKLDEFCSGSHPVSLAEVRMALTDIREHLLAARGAAQQLLTSELGFGSTVEVAKIESDSRGTKSLFRRVLEKAGKWLVPVLKLVI